MAATDVLWVGAQGEIEEMLVPRAGLTLETIDAGPIAGRPLQEKVVNGLKLARSVGRAGKIMDRFQPQALLMTGGYVSGPVAWAAWRRRLPTAIYLPDIEPGLAIKRLSRLATKVACTAAASQRYFPAGKCVVTGYPVRPEIRQATIMPTEKALAQFGLAAGRPTLLVFGGSRGARSINRALMANLRQITQVAQVIHVSGQLDWPEVEAFAANLPADVQAVYRPYAYLHEEMGAAYRAADLALARAGASLLGECPAFGLPAILVPYPYAWRYQKVNADYLVARGAAVRLNDEELGEKMRPVIVELLNDPQRLADMAAAARALDTPKAAANIADLLLQVRRGTSPC